MGMTDEEFISKLQQVRCKASNSEKCIMRWDLGIDILEAKARLIMVGKTYTPDFIIDKQNDFLYTNILKWIHGDRSMQALHPESKKVVEGKMKAGIFIAGPAGTGKTMALNVIRDYSIVVGAKVLLLPYDEPSELVWKNYNASDITNEYLHKGDICEHENKRILCIQDLGCEPSSVSYMGNNINVLKSLIERRGDYSNRITLITSNLSISGKMMQERYGERVISRLRQMCNYYELKGNDRRM